MTIKPTTILHNANIITFDDGRPRASALAIAGDRILAVGDSADIRSLAASGTEVIDLGGATLIPGINDAHAHMEREGLKRRRPSLAGVRNHADILERVADAVRVTPPGEWVVTMPVGTPPYFFDSVASLDEGVAPDRHALDRIAPDHPVYIQGHFGNWGKPPGTSILNSRALALNGITRDSVPTCSGVEIVKDANGEPTGVIIEHNPRPTVEFDLLPAVPRFGFQDRLEGVRLSQQLYNAKGTTSIYEGHGSAPETISVYRRLWEQGELSVRVGLTVSPVWADIREAQLAMRDWLAYARGAGLGDPWLRISGVHIAYGGSPAVACCARANLPDTGWSGFVEQALSPGDYREALRLAAEHNLRVHTIVSDKLHEVVPVLEAVNEVYPLAGRRWVIEHIGRSRLEDLRALKRLGVMVTTIPAYFLWKGGHQYLDEPHGGDLMVPHRHLLNLGIPTAIATDGIPYDPFFGLWTVCNRQERVTGQVIGPDQRLDAETALGLFTHAGAALTFDEGWKGRIKPGFASDLAVLSADPTAIDPADLRSISARLTMVGGRIVHRDGV